MAERLTLIGFKHSVYTWIVRMALHELALSVEYVEANPFADPPDATLAHFTPFRRVPVLMHGTFRLTETAAILRYLDAHWGQGRFSPKGAKAQAQMAQVTGLVDADIYPILVRQVFSQGYYLPVVVQQQGDPGKVTGGLQAAGPVLQVLAQIASDGRVLNGTDITLADLQLAPMMSYAMRVPEMAKVLASFPALDAWWQDIRQLPSLTQTDPLSQI